MNTGLFDKAYLNTGTYAVPVWTEIKQVGDIKHGDERNMAKVKIREFQHELHLPGQRNQDVELNIVKNPGNTVWETLWDAYSANPPTPKEFLLMYSGDSATSGSEGVRMHCEIASFGADQNIDDTDFNVVKLAPSARLQGAETTIHEPAVFAVP